MKRIVMKFGGTSVGSSDAIERVVEIIRSSAAHAHIVVVVSAMSSEELRTTNTLVSAARAAAAGDSAYAAGMSRKLLQMHCTVAKQLTNAEEYEQLVQEFTDIFEYITNLSRSIAILGELTPRALDLISGQGERCNARLIAAALRSRGVAAEAIDATDVIITDDVYGDASPLMDETTARSRERLLPLMDHGTIPVVTGFIGGTTSGVMTTLGRGGSDYTCAILGATLDADEVWFWKEVNGVMTADPRIVPEAHTLPNLSYTEMSELAYYGANILHPRAVYPLVQKRIPIRMLNTFQPDHPGTWITADAVSGTAKAVTAIRTVSLITVAGPGMLGLTGLAGRIFQAVARVRTNVLLITQGSSEQNICFAVPHRESGATVAELRRELALDMTHHNIDHVDVIEPVSIIAIVGSGMRGTPGIAGRVFGALGDAAINVIAIAQGSTEYNISLVVAETDGDRAVQVIHRAFHMEAA